MSEEVQRFSATSGRIYGTLAMVVVAVVVVLVLLDEGEPSYAALALMIFLGAGAWAALLRPRLDLDSERLVMRNMLSTDTLPLTAIESVAVRQVLVVRAGDKRFTSAAVGRSRRQLVKDGRPGGGSGGISGGGSGGVSGGSMMGMLPSLPAAPASSESATTSYGLFVEERIRSRVADALARAGITARSAEQAAAAEGITRRPALPELVVLGASLLAFVALVLA